MTRDEFKRQLEQLQEVIHRALAYYTVWKALKLHDKGTADWSLEDQNAVLDRCKGFFTPVAFALLDMALIQFAKVFDNDPRTASMTNLLGAAQSDPGCLVPHVSLADLHKVSEQIKASEATLATLKDMRNQRLAHADVAPAPSSPLLTMEFDKFTETVEAAFNALSVGHDKNFFSFDFSLRESARHTAEILRVLLDHRASTRQEFDDEMVRIGLAEVRRTEREIGRQLNKEAVRSIVRSLGLTMEQMQRVEEAYGAVARGGVSS